MYLWVDAICIIQGKDNLAGADWKAESARMHRIYGEALLTIAVATSSMFLMVFPTLKAL
jgi:hypothetical protein